MSCSVPSGSIRRPPTRVRSRRLVILVVTLDPALDVTHQVPGADWSGVNRSAAVRTRPGGKGLNVARTLRALGAQVHAIGFLGGLTGQAVRSGLDEAGVPATFTPITGCTRRTFTVVDDARGRVAGFYEPGPAVTCEEYLGLTVLYKRKLDGCAAVVLSGSLPPGVPADSYAALAKVAADAGVPALVDAGGPPLLAAAAVDAAVVKPNLAELERSTGRRLAAASGRPDLAAVGHAAAGLRAAGALAVVVSLGPDGLLAVTAEQTWRVVSAGPVAGNPTGAGDAVAAGLALGLSRGEPWEERLRQAVALGAAAVAAPAAGDIDLAAYRCELAGVRVVTAGEQLCR
jgi:tagatose 6-phosphate kinase